MNLLHKRHIVVHSGKFHPDEAFAAAALKLAFGKGGAAAEFRVVRTRDEAVIAATLEKAAIHDDFVVDVGGGYDPDRHLFDHHQPGGAGTRENGIPYASFGLIWKHYGERACAHVADLSDDKWGKAAAAEIAALVDEKLVAPLDAEDNAISLCSPTRSDVAPYELSDVVDAFLPNWDDSASAPDDRFEEVVQFAVGLLSKEIARAASKVSAREKVEMAYRAAEDKRVIVLDGRFPWRDVLLRYAEPLAIIGPDVQNGTWAARVMPADAHTFDNRMLFPQEWAGKRDADLAAASGVSDAVFCHNGRFLAVAKSKEGAIALAKKAVAMASSVGTK